MEKYEKYDLKHSAELALNYLTRMVDVERDYLPYWLIQITKAPAWAKHCRVDDAELVASWYEAIVCTRMVLDTPEGEEAKEGFKRHIYSHWHTDGLRYHEPYPWTHTIHHSFHEDSYLLPALNRIIEVEHESRAEELAAGLVRALRKLVYHRKRRCFWSGDMPIAEKVYEFPNDIYLKDRGFDFSCVTGRGEQSIRNAIMLHGLVRHWQITGDKVSLDLAEGIANHLLGQSRYFNYKGEFFGHVHSAMWAAAGLVLLGRLRENERYIKWGRMIYDYVKSLSSEFGWVPEYAQLHPMAEEHCETCCIRDMILCGFELIDAGDDKPYDLINRYARNQLYEQQIKTGGFVGVDNDRKPEEPGITYQNIDQRVVGGWTGGGEPASISLSRFRSIAGCCVGTAPQALHQVWSRIMEDRESRIFVNFPISYSGDLGKVEIGYPNEGLLKVECGKPGKYAIRLYDFMGDDFVLSVNETQISPHIDNGCAVIEGMKKGDQIRLTHTLESHTTHERVRGQDMDIKWKGSDVVEVSPPGEPLRLYQRKLGVPKDIPPPPKISEEVTCIDAAPTEQKR
ncbi:MAG: hypothetical protein ACOCVH_00935 [Verrucomicrobiota bacterium]